MDRNLLFLLVLVSMIWSLSVRRAWIEMRWAPLRSWYGTVALRKESVDRNLNTGSLAVAATSRSP